MVGGLFLDAAVDIQTGDRRRLLTYALPEHLADRITERQLIWVPVRKELKLALVVRIHDQAPQFAVRPVYAPVESQFRLSPEQWALVEWLCDETLCSLFEAATPFLPPGVGERTVEHLRLRDGIDTNTLELTPVQRQLVDLLTTRSEVTVEAARRALGRSLRTVVTRLEQAGVIERVAHVRNRPSQAAMIRYIRLVPDANGAELAQAPAQRRAMEVLQRRLRLSMGEPVAWDDVIRRPGVTAAALRALAKRGLIEVLTLPSAIPEHPANGVGRGGVELTSEQAATWQHILGALRNGSAAEFLLHGVTGSGKTELYLRAAAWCINRGRRAVILVPEIALATQIVHRFTERFPGQVAVLHSALAKHERYQTWAAIAEGRLPVVVGPRSALFAPLSRIGLVVVDEEHEAAYKQDAPPRYHARAVARQLSQQHGAVLLLGSATPDVTTYYRAEQDSATLLELSERVGPPVLGGNGREERGRLDLPAVEVVDMRAELRQGNRHIFSQALQGAVERALAAGEQTILFLNRRGSSTIVQCRACGHVELCPFCDIPFIYHGNRQLLICHRCNHRQAPPVHCPTCATSAIGYYGTGTQRVERETQRLLPTARVLRWDQDALRRGVEHRHLIQRVRQHEVDIIVGTQMVAKGFDFPLVSTIGVINADTLLHLPDFRAAERTFQLLTQVAGRAGRRTPGARVIVQSYSPNHYAIQAASRHDYAAFYAEELAFRRHHGYPPFRRLVRLVYRHTDETTCQSSAEEVAELLAQTAQRLGLRRVDLLGPTPAFAARVRGRYQWQMLLRGPDARQLAASIELDPGWLIDVDPESLL